MSDVYDLTVTRQPDVLAEYLLLRSFTAVVCSEKLEVPRPSDPSILVFTKGSQYDIDWYHPTGGDPVDVYYHADSGVLITSEQFKAHFETVTEQEAKSWR